MATHGRQFYWTLSPDTSGNAFWQPASILDTNDLDPTNYELIFLQSVAGAAYGRFKVPNNYVSTARIVYRYKTTVTSGNVLWTLDYRAIAAGESLDPSTWQESFAGTATAVPGTTNLAGDISFTLTDANLAVGDTVLVKVQRNGAGADTAAASMRLVDAEFNYADV